MANQVLNGGCALGSTDVVRNHQHARADVAVEIIQANGAATAEDADSGGLRACQTILQKCVVLNGVAAQSLPSVDAATLVVDEQVADNRRVTGAVADIEPILGCVVNGITANLVSLNGPAIGAVAQENSEAAGKANEVVLNRARVRAEYGDTVDRASCYGARIAKTRGACTDDVVFDDDAGEVGATAIYSHTDIGVGKQTTVAEAVDSEFADCYVVGLYIESYGNTARIDNLELRTLYA